MGNMRICCGKQHHEYPEGLLDGPVDLGGGRKWKTRIVGSRPLDIRSDCCRFDLKGPGSFTCPSCSKINPNPPKISDKPHKNTPHTYLSKGAIGKMKTNALKSRSYFKVELHNLKYVLKSTGISPKGVKHSDVQSIMEETIKNLDTLFEGKEKDEVREIITDQIKMNSAATDPNASARWLPGTIRLGLALGQASKGYGQLRRALKLPAKRTLDNYTDWVDTSDGCHLDILSHMYRHTLLSEKTKENPQAATMGILSHDAMSVKKGLVYGRHGQLEGLVEYGTADLIAEVLGEVEAATGDGPAAAAPGGAAAAGAGDDAGDGGGAGSQAAGAAAGILATHYFVFYWSSLGSGISFPVAHWRIANESAEFVMESVMEVLETCFSFGLDTIGVVCDGAEWNRSAQKKCATMSLADLGLSGNTLQCAFSHPGHGRPVFNLPDPKHLIKKWRNALYDSGRLERDADGKVKTGKDRDTRFVKTLSRALPRGGYEVAVWKHLQKAYEYLNPTKEFRWSVKISREHIHLNNRSSKMRVYLAEGVTSDEACDMLEYWAGSADPQKESAAGISFTVQYLKWGARIKDFYSKGGAFRHEDDKRLGQLETVVEEVQQWRDGLVGNLPDGQTMRQSFIPSDKLFYDLQLYQASVTGIVKLLITKHKMFVSVGKLHSDYCEHHFQHVRQGNGSAADNPTVEGAARSCRKSMTARAVSGDSKGRGGNTSGTVALHLPDRPPTKAEHESIHKAILDPANKSGKYVVTDSARTYSRWEFGGGSDAEDEGGDAGGGAGSVDSDGDHEMDHDGIDSDGSHDGDVGGSAGMALDVCGSSSSDSDPEEEEEDDEDDSKVRSCNK